MRPNSSCSWLAVCLIGALAPQQVWAMDFTPRQTRTLEDGVPSMRSFFKDGNAQIFFHVAKGWRMAGGGNEVMIYPSSLDGYIRLGNSPVGAAVPFDENGLPTYVAAARSMLPKQAETIEILSEEADAYPLDDWKSYEIWFSYEVCGVKSVCWILFITMTPDRQICYVVDGKKQNFDAIYADSRSMLGSWFEPPTGWPLAAR